MRYFLLAGCLVGVQNSTSEGSAGSDKFIHPAPSWVPSLLSFLSLLLCSVSILLGSYICYRCSKNLHHKKYLAFLHSWNIFAMLCKGLFSFTQKMKTTSTSTNFITNCYDFLIKHKKKGLAQCLRISLFSKQWKRAGNGKISTYDYVWHAFILKNQQKEKKILFKTKNVKLKYAFAHRKHNLYQPHSFIH